MTDFFYLNLSFFFINFLFSNLILNKTTVNLYISELNRDSSAYQIFPALNSMLKDTISRDILLFLLQKNVSKKHNNWRKLI